MASVVSCMYVLLLCTNLTLHICGNQLTPTSTPVPPNPSRIASPLGLSKEIENIYCSYFCLTYKKNVKNLLQFVYLLYGSG